MSTVLIAGVASIMLSLAALPPLDETTVAADIKAGAGVHHPESGIHRMPEPVEKVERHESAPDRPACASGRIHDTAKLPRCTAVPTRRSR